MQILLASSNPHKLQEITAIWGMLSAQLGGLAGREKLELVGLDQMTCPVTEPVEDQDDFEGNALLKAHYYAHHYNMLTLADDSGLEVDALDGAPGVFSARYAGKTGPRHEIDPANNKLVMQRLADMPADQRTARFICAMALCSPGDEAVGATFKAVGQQRCPQLPIVVRGSLEGRILTRDQAGEDAAGLGQYGFGYDPLFYLPQRQCTSAQLTPEEKNKISHRSQAASLMYEKMMGPWKH